MQVYTAAALREVVYGLLFGALFVRNPPNAPTDPTACNCPLSYAIKRYDTRCKRNLYAAAGSFASESSIPSIMQAYAYTEFISGAL